MTQDRKLRCGCYAAEIGGTWRISAMAFLCPSKHVSNQPLSEQETDDEPCECPHPRPGEIQCCFIQTGTCCHECVSS